MSATSLIPQKAAQRVHLGQLTGSASAYVLAQIVNLEQKLTLLITKDMQQALHFQSELPQFTQKPITLLSDWETLPYDQFSPRAETISSRLVCLSQLPSYKEGIFIVPITSLMQRVCPQDYITSHVFMMKTGMDLARDAFRLQLEQAGYHAVHQVMQAGEFAVRGALFDLYPVGSDVPYRIDFFDDEIDSIRTFDINTQLTIEKVDEIRLLPAREFPTHAEAIDLFRQQWRERFPTSREKDSIYQQISTGHLPAGIEYWQPLFFNAPLVPLFTYLPSDTLIVTVDDLHDTMQQFWRDISRRYESLRHDIQRPLLPPETLWLRENELFSELKHYPLITLSSKPIEENTRSHNLAFSALPNVSVNPSHKVPCHALQTFLAQFTGIVVFSCESHGRKDVLLDLLNRHGIYPLSISSLNDATQSGHYIMIGECEYGFIDHDKHLALITESNLFGQKATRTQRKKEHKTLNADAIVRNLAELHIGQPVVHLQHGVGRYAGLTTLEAGGITAEYMIIHYANDSKLYVPIASLNMISRYVGGDEEHAPLHKLGNENWGKARQKAVERARDIAAELLDIYAQRDVKTGFAFQFDDELYQKFSEGFLYELTDDQQNAINAVINDMCSPAPMDRLICGDVGFGKTEVAIRAAFLSVINQKQVAILVPTTLLAQQHYENFLERFAGWPINIEMISRFRTPKQQKAIIEQVKDGKIDILIGTHKLLQNDIKWHDLGLLIVDEEHRFGVKQKEKIKALRANIDILTLTATPIPRTLNMAMHSIRDLSIIATPPARRLAVKTFVRERDDLVIREAILREMLRGGQVYYLFNEVDRIERVKEQLLELVPDAKIAIGHGQMNERELEQVMNDFYHQRYNVLLCTTIIETGIDVPSANTIIIERADKFGLAQLHQLRGRVGRSHHQAYAYLLTPPIKSLNKDAKKRLEAIASLEDLGAGFILATHDLEIRGAGEILGEEQSGQIATIGFSLYMELLEHSIEALKNGKEPSLESLLSEQTEVELRVPALIPGDFIGDVSMRLSLYKRIASTKNTDELQALRIEMIDRFGLLPSSVKYLFSLTELKQRAQMLGIKKIEFNDKGGKIEFNEKHSIAITFLLTLINQDPSHYKLEGNTGLKITQSLPDYAKRIECVEQLITDFEHHQQ